MHEDLKSKIVSIAEKYADLIDSEIVKVALKKESKNPEIEIGGELHEIADSIRILHHTIAMLERLNRIGPETTNAVQPQGN